MSNQIMKMLHGQIRQLKWDVENAHSETQNVRRELAAAVALADERRRILDRFVEKALR